MCWFGIGTPKGVLWLSVTESVVAFQSTEEMLAMAHLVTMATAWQNVPIKLYTHPPTATHIRTYVAWRSACPSSTQSDPRKG